MTEAEAIRRLAASADEAAGMLPTGIEADRIARALVRRCLDEHEIQQLKRLRYCLWALRGFAVLGLLVWVFKLVTR